MAFTADLHLRSRYACACSKNLTLANMALWAKAKGIELLSTADFTHLAWLSELEKNLTPTKDGDFEFEGVRFVLEEVAGVANPCHYPAFSSLRSPERG